MLKPRDEDDSGRLRREAEFHDVSFANNIRQVTDKYYQVTRQSSARYRGLVLERADSMDVLEYGCGTGSLALDIVRRGGRVTGVDISPGAIEIAQKAAIGLEGKTRFMIMNAEQLEFPDRSFDVVCGSGILHHLNLDKAYSEISRVLRPGGSAFFLEPLGHNAIINLYRKLTPSLRTPDEHPLLSPDIALASKYFRSVQVEYFHIFSIASAWLPAWLNIVYRPVAIAVDKVLTQRWSPLRFQAWMSVLQFR